MPSVDITEDRIVVTEGKDGERFCVALLDEIGNLDGVQVTNCGGRDRLGRFLKALSSAPGFGSVEALFVIRDADQDAGAAFQSVTALLANADLPAPGASATVTPGSPQTGVFILPDNQEPGELETLCLQAVDEEPTMDCVDDLIECVNNTAPGQLVNRQKSRLHSYLSVTPDPGLKLGEAAMAGHLNLQSDTYDALRHFLAQL